MIEDPALPAAAHLLGDGAWDLVAAGIVGLGGELRRLDPAQVIYRPGSELIVRYDATVAWSDGRIADEVLCAGTTKRGAHEGTVPLVADGLEAGLWRYPFDPALPGLQAAVTAPGVAAVAGAIVGANPTLTMRAYRPSRRAVVHAVGDLGEAYLKVVRPSAFDAMVATHRALEGALPVPDVLAGDPAAGILVLRALSGDGLRDRLREGGRPWPDADEILGMLDRLAVVPALPGMDPVTPILRGVGTHLTMIERALGGVEPVFEVLRSELVDAATPDASSTPHPQSLIHGDLHEAQLLVDAGGHITGVLDIDGVGPGERADDLGRLLGHLSALGLGAGGHRPAIDGYVDELRAGFATVVDAVELDRRAAAVATGLAVGPFRVQMERWQVETRRRLELARWWATGRRGHPPG